MIFQTVCADTGVPLAVSASAISVTEWSRARSANALSRTLPAMRGPLGPGLDWVNSCSFPRRSRVAIWWTLAVE